MLVCIRFNVRITQFHVNILCIEICNMRKKIDLEHDKTSEIAQTDRAARCCCDALTLTCLNKGKNLWYHWKRARLAARLIYQQFFLKNAWYSVHSFFLIGCFNVPPHNRGIRCQIVCLGAGESNAPTLGLTRATEGKWMGCLQTAINWAWLVCHHLPISCGLLSLPETEDVGRWRDVWKVPAPVHQNWTELTCDLDIAHHLDQQTLQARQNKYMYTHKLLTIYSGEKTSMQPVRAQGTFGII